VIFGHYTEEHITWLSEQLVHFSFVIKPK